MPTAIRLVTVHGVQELRTGADMRCTGGNNERQEMFMRRGLFRDSSYMTTNFKMFPLWRVKTALKPRSVSLVKHWEHYLSIN